MKEGPLCRKVPGRGRRPTGRWTVHGWQDVRRTLGLGRGGCTGKLRGHGKVLQEKKGNRLENYDIDGEATLEGELIKVLKMSTFQTLSIFLKLGI